MNKKQAAVSSNQSVKTADQEPLNSALIIVLQWLSYAFWGWLVGSLIWLIVAILNYLIADNLLDGMLPYSIAAVVVLTPLALVVDKFYRKHEPVKKHGMAAVVMVIHAVLYALIALGTIISAVFVAISFITSVSADSSAMVVALLSLLIASLLFASLFVRIIRPNLIAKLSAKFSLVLLVIAIVALAAGVAGPLVQSIELKSDRLIESNLPRLSRLINQYVNDNKKLPSSLDELQPNIPSVEALIDSQLVSYKNNVTPKPTEPTSPTNLTQRHHYQLCATYIAEDNANETYYPETYSEGKDGEYATYVSTYGHPAGEVCYKLVASSYNSLN